MKRVYCIADIGIWIEKDHLLDISWEKFKLIQNEEIFQIEIKVIIPPIDDIYYSIQKIIISEGYKIILRINSDIMIVSENWRICSILPLDNIENLQTFLNQIFYTRALYKNIIQLHSSLIKFCEKGIMFLGPSGIGKTTQAELWNKYRDALIINGDIVFVQETEENFLGWGTPWHGSSPYCENTSVPVHAMIVLKQAPENSIRELTGFEKVTAVSNNVFYPQWLENGMELCLETLDHLLSAIPVYELSCRPDEEAVRLTEETLFGN